MDEGYFNTKYVWAHNEFTPQQTMRGKMALYGYLYGISKDNASVAHFEKRPGSCFSITADIIRGDRIQIIDIAGRLIWSGAFDGHAAALKKRVPSSGIFFIKQTHRSGAVIRLRFVKT
jgi:hypothetical protein